MKIMKVVVILLIVITCISCGKKTGLKEQMDFKVEDIKYISVIISTPEESGSLNTANTEGIQKFLELLQGVEVKKKLNQTKLETTDYYDYTLTLAVDTTFRLTDYKDKIKIVDAKGKESWYEISSNTWEGLTPLWKEYYVKPTGIVTPNISTEPILAKKPVIYLYPEKTTEISVKLDLQGELTYTYPSYQDGWRVIANPDGSLFNKSDNKVYSYLFWEGLSAANYDMSKGFVVKGEDTTEFLEEKLSYLGLTNKEYNDFIVYWAPDMSENNYNLITFQGDAYTDDARLTITPEPDSTLRVFMVYQPLVEYMDIPEQKLEQWGRTGYSLVEWGGAMINQ